MKHTIAAALLAALVGIAPAATLAGTQDPGINKRQQLQGARIKQGIGSGELTGREAHGLIHGQRRIHRKEHRYKSDGNLTPRERADLHRDLNRNSRRIYRQKHDGQSR